MFTFTHTMFTSSCPYINSPAQKLNSCYSINFAGKDQTSAQSAPLHDCCVTHRLERRYRGWLRRSSSWTTSFRGAHAGSAGLQRAPFRIVLTCPVGGGLTWPSAVVTQRWRRQEGGEGHLPYIHMRWPGPTVTPIYRWRWWPRPTSQSRSCDGLGLGIGGGAGW